MVVLHHPKKIVKSKIANLMFNAFLCLLAFCLHNFDGLIYSPSFGNGEMGKWMGEAKICVHLAPLNVF